MNARQMLAATLVGIGLGALAGSACGPGYRDDYDVRIDEAFSYDERAQIIASLREWETKTSATDLVGVHFASIGVVDTARAWRANDGELVFVAAAGGECPHNRRLEKARAIALSYTSAWTHFACFDLGWFHAKKAKTGVDYLPRVVLHETGHALGLGHYVDPPPSVMRPIAEDQPEHLQCIDVAAYCIASEHCSLTEKDCQ